MWFETLQAVIAETIFTGSLLTGAKPPALSTNHLADTDKLNRTTSKSKDKTKT